MGRVFHLYIVILALAAILSAACILATPRTLQETRALANTPAIPQYDTDQASQSTDTPVMVVTPTEPIVPTSTSLLVMTPTMEPKEGWFYLPEEEAPLLKHHLSPDGSLAGLSTRNKLYVFNTRPFKLAYTMDTPDGSVNFTFSPDGKLGAIKLNNDVNVQLFDAQTGEFTQVLPGEKQVNDRLLFSASGPTLVGLSGTSSVDVWDISTGEHRNWFAMEGEEGQVGLSYGGGTIAVGGVLESTITGEPVPSDNWMYSLGTLFTPMGMCIRNVEYTSPGFAIAHSPDFETSVEGVEAPINSERFVISSADESLVAVQTLDDTVVIVDGFTRKTLMTDFLPDNYVILDMAFTLDGILLELIRDQTVPNQFAVFIREVNPRE